MNELAHDEQLISRDGGTNAVVIAYPGSGRWLTVIAPSGVQGIWLTEEMTEDLILALAPRKTFGVEDRNLNWLALGVFVSMGTLAVLAYKVISWAL